VPARMVWEPKAAVALSMSGSTGSGTNIPPTFVSVPQAQGELATKTNATHGVRLSAIGRTANAEGDRRTMDTTTPATRMESAFGKRCFCPSVPGMELA